MTEFRTGVSREVIISRIEERVGVITGKAAPSTDASVELVAEASKTLSQLPVSHAAPSQGSSNNFISKKGLG